MIKKPIVKEEKSLSITPKVIAPISEQIVNLEIKDEGSMRKAVEYLSQANNYLDNVVAYKEKKTKPLNDLKKIILAETKPIETTLEDLISGLRKKMSVYQTAETKRLQEKEDAIANRVGKGKGKLTNETAGRQIAELEIVPEKVATTSGKVTFKPVKKFEVLDVTALPPDCIMADETVIRDKMKAGIEVTGVRYFEEQVPINFR